MDWFYALLRAPYLATLVTLVPLVVTGFVGWWSHGRLSGWLLWVHVAVGPLFVCAFTLLALGAADKCRLGRTNSVPTEQKLVFWAAMLLGFVTVTSILTAMTPWFGSAGQETLYNVHRYSAMGLVIVALVHGVSLLISRWRGRIEHVETQTTSGSMGSR